MKKQVMLITYADSMGHNLADLREVLRKHYQGAIGSVHILPFFPSSADRGFAPMRYDQVDPAFGDWADVKALAQDYDLMFDFMINHISSSSPYYLDFLKNKDASPYKDFFIRYKDFWEGGEPTQEQVDAIYKRKPRAPFADAEFADGTTEKVWCTFDSEQIDLDLRKPATRDFVNKTLVALAENGAKMIRLDAFAYAIKEAGTSCFFIEPGMWELLRETQEVLAPYGVEILPEIHEHYTIQKKLADRDFYVYDFALPMLLLHALYAGTNERLLNWLRICPRNQFTTLDTHDGIGVVDVRDLMTDEEIEQTKEDLFTKGANVKKIYNTTAYNNLDIYQVNCTYYSALGNNDDAYLTARAIQFFAPGIPQIYYVGMLAGENDLQLLEETKVGRNINRHYYSLEEIEQNQKRPVIQRLNALMRFRNNHPAFQGGVEILPAKDGSTVEIVWRNEAHMAHLVAVVKQHKFVITHTSPDAKEMQRLQFQ